MLDETEVAELARSIRDRVVRDLLIPSLIPADVTAYNAVTGVATVHLDTDTDPNVRVPAQSLVGTVAAGDRVMVIFQPPHTHLVGWGPL